MRLEAVNPLFFPARRGIEIAGKIRKPLRIASLEVPGHRRGHHRAKGFRKLAVSSAFGTSPRHAQQHGSTTLLGVELSGPESRLDKVLQHTLCHASSMALRTVDELGQDILINIHTLPPALSSQTGCRESPWWSSTEHRPTRDPLVSSPPPSADARYFHHGWRYQMCPSTKYGFVSYRGSLTRKNGQTLGS